MIREWIEKINQSLGWTFNDWYMVAVMTVAVFAIAFGLKAQSDVKELQQRVDRQADTINLNNKTIGIMLKNEQNFLDWSTTAQTVLINHDDSIRELVTGRPYDPFAQDAFPCQEDEWLGFSPVSTSRLVCVSREGR